VPTDYHPQYYAHELTRQCSANDVGHELNTHNLGKRKPMKESDPENRDVGCSLREVLW